MKQWRVDKFGRIYSHTNNLLGRIYASGDVEDQNNIRLGEVDVRGDAWDIMRNHLGWADSDFKIYDKRHFHIAEITNSGEVVNFAKTTIGVVDISIKGPKTKAKVRPMYMRAAAAAQLFFHQED